MLRSLVLSIVALTLPLVARAQTPQWGVAATYPISGGSVIHDVADLNLDGKLDVVVVGVSMATIMLGQADGTFQVQAVSPSTGLSGGALALGLLDGDSFPDALTASRLMHGNGDGTFAQATVQPVGLFGFTGAVAVGDLNGDGRLDLVAASNGQLRIALADGSGGFYLSLAYPSCGNVSYMAVADIDADGDSDILSACSGGQGFAIHTNNLPLGFSTQGYGRDDASRPVVGDFTGDAIPDMVTSRRFFTGHGGGLFTPGPLMPNIAYGWYEGFDCDGDGHLDFAGRNNCSPCALVVARGQGNGTFDDNCTVPFPFGAPDCVRAADVLGDHRDELLVLAGWSSGNALFVVRNLAPDCNNNGIDDPVEIAMGGSTDCNGNGIPDFCEGDCDANGMFDPCQIAAHPEQDLDADGTLDICEIAGIPYCFGDGTGNACPCDPGQAGSIGSGCRNSGGNGARLEARGNPSVSVDSVTLRASGILPTAIGLLFQGNQQQAGGLGGTFGDGLLCVNASVVRLGLRNASGGALSFGYGVPGDPSIAAQGQVPASGATRYYQHWYRDPAPFCTAGTFNLTNAVRIDWNP